MLCFPTIRSHSCGDILLPLERHVIGQLSVLQRDVEKVGHVVAMLSTDKDAFTAQLIGMVLFAQVQLVMLGMSIMRV